MITFSDTLHRHLVSNGASSVVGVSVGAKDDRSTWRVDFAPEATDAQKAQAAQIVAAFDVEKVRHNAAIDAQIVAIEAQITQRMLRDAAAGTPPKEYRELVARIDELRGQRRK